MKKLLIIGANGFTGRRLLRDFTNNPSYIITACSLKPDIDPQQGYRFVQTDVCNTEALRELFDTVHPDVVVNTSALSVPDYCETHHAEADLLNTHAVEQMAKLCETHHCRFIHLSTDFVFDGKTDTLYTEEDLPSPVNYYGLSKLNGERAVARCCSDYAIVRVVVVYGKALPGQHGNIFQLVANKLRSGEAIRVVSDQWRTPTFVGDISLGIEKLANTAVNGIFHICGKENISIAEIAYRVADYLNLDSSLIQPVTTEEMQEATPRPRFSGLSIEKARRTLGYEPLTIAEGMKEMFG